MVLRVAIALLFCSSVILAQAQQPKGYVVTDPNGRGVYLIPECIAEKTVSTTMSLPADAPKAPIAAGGERGLFMVQVGAFAVPANAARLAENLSKEGYRVQRAKAFFRTRNLGVEVVSVGAFATRSEAERALKQINEAYDVESLVVPSADASLASQ